MAEHCEMPTKDRESNPFKRGDLVWCYFPFSENPDRPADVPHIGYLEEIIDIPDKGLHAVLLYTTSKPISDERRERYFKGSMTFSDDDAKEMGLVNPKGFTINPNRIAILPINKDYFPWIDEKRHGIKGRLPDNLALQMKDTLRDILKEKGRIFVVGQSRTLLDPIRQPDLVDQNWQTRGLSAGEAKSRNLANAMHAVSERFKTSKTSSPNPTAKEPASDRDATSR